MALQELNRVKDLAREWGICVETVRNWIKVHKIPVNKPSRRTIIITRKNAELFWRRVAAKFDD